MKADTILEFDSLYALIIHFDSEEKCEEHLANLRWGGEPVCPSCNCKKVGKLNGKRKRFKCYGCKRKFSVKTGSIFHDSKLPLLKWFVAIYLFSSHKRGISSHQLARDLKISQKSAWYVLHRIREIYVQETEEKMDGVVQIDETYVGGEIHRMNAKTRAKYENTKSNDAKTPVLGITDGEEVIAMPVEEVTKRAILPILDGKIDESAIVVTDGLPVYNKLSKSHSKHVVVSHSQGEYVVDGFTTNNIECFWSHMKRGIIGTYFHASKGHLGSYVDEFAFRFNTRKMGEGERFDLTLAKSNKTLSWNELVEKGKRRA